MSARDIILAELPCNIVYGRGHAVDGILSALIAAGYRLIGPGSVEPIDYEKIDVPADIQEFGERNKMPEFANATYRNGYVDGYRFAIRSLQGGEDA